MDQEGFERLFSDDGYISRNTIQRFSYDIDLLKKILEAAGKWQDVLKIDETKLKKISRELPSDVRAKIEQARKINKEYKTFSVRKRKKEGPRNESWKRLVAGRRLRGDARGRRIAGGPRFGF